MVDSLRLEVADADGDHGSVNRLAAIGSCVSNVKRLRPSTARARRTAPSALAWVCAGSRAQRPSLSLPLLLRAHWRRGEKSPAYPFSSLPTATEAPTDARVPRGKTPDISTGRVSRRGTPPSAPNELLRKAEAWCRFNLSPLRHDPERQRSRRTGNRDPAGSGPLVSCDATLAGPLPDYRASLPPVGREQTLPHVGVISTLVGEPARRRRRGRAGAATGRISTARPGPAQR
jgi:hypothetical protein